MIRDEHTTNFFSVTVKGNDPRNLPAFREDNEGHCAFLDGLPGGTRCMWIWNGNAPSDYTLLAE